VLAQTGGYRLAFLVAATLVVAALAVTVAVVRPAGEPAKVERPEMPELVPSSR
jgi:hypothetical protein